MERLILDVRETCSALGISRPTLWRISQTNALPEIRIGRKVGYSVEALRAFVANGGVRTLPQVKPAHRRK